MLCAFPWTRSPEIAPSSPPCPLSGLAFSSAVSCRDNPTAAVSEHSHCTAAKSTYRWQCHRRHLRFPPPGRRNSAACSSPPGSAHSTCSLSGSAVSIPLASIVTDHSSDAPRRRRTRMRTAFPGGIDYMGPDTLVWASRQPYRCCPDPFSSLSKSFWRGRSRRWPMGNAQRLSSSSRGTALGHHPSSQDHCKTLVPHMAHSQFAPCSMR